MLVAGEVRVALALAVRVNDGVTEAEAVALGRPVGVELGMGVVVEVATAVGLQVNVGVTVLVEVTVRVGVCDGVGVGRAVSVFVGVGWLPIRTTTCTSGPRVPPVSRTWMATSVSPSAKPVAPAITRQNCVTRGCADTNAGVPNASTVQARREAVATPAVHAKSLSAFATCWLGPKSNGLNPGMPPSVHTWGSPSPSGRDVSTCKSGRACGSVGTALKTLVPIGAPSAPGTASTTN